MNLSKKEIDAIKKIQELTEINDRTRIISLSLELAKTILEEKQKGNDLFFRDKNENENHVLFIVS